MVSFHAITFASELPKEFWSINDQYVNAMTLKDNANIILYGQKTIDLIGSLPENDQNNEIMASRLDQIGLAYERIGEFQKAGACYQLYLPYVIKKGLDDNIKVAKAKVLQYCPTLDIYTGSTQEQVNFHAKNEPSNGILYGVNADGGTRASLPNESMTLVYVPFGETNFWWLEENLKEATQKGIAVEVALNVTREGSELAEILTKSDYIISLLKVIEGYNKTPVYLRFGAEMNLWVDQAKPNEFIDAFRLVATLAKKHTTNVAMVWSVGQASAWHVNMNDYYPGDEYVDWVGVSAYMQKYFLGRNDWKDDETLNEVLFLTGKGADPVMALTEVISLYGNRKPIMLAESGVSHYIRPLKEDTTAWATNYLKKMYYEVPMVYPQVKLIAYFDREILYETDDYALSNNKTIASLYQDLVRQPSFIQKAYTNIPKISYQKAENIINLSQPKTTFYAYAHAFGRDNVTINYYLNDQWIAGKSELPYASELDFAKYSEGSHGLTVKAESNGTVFAQKKYTVQIVKGITVLVNQKPVQFDQQPVIENGRTLVPMRAIFEAMGVKIDWDEKTKTVIAMKDDIKIEVKIDSNIFLKNNTPQTLEVAPKIIGGRTMLPVRAIVEALGAEVNWDGDKRTISIQY
ncbi:MAG: hypothetical protein H7Y41_06035 [Hyphomonadaceae bacterium]|nr:hypothetical protein [Clostridia bacterium]